MNRFGQLLIIYSAALSTSVAMVLLTSAAYIRLNRSTRSGSTASM